MDCAPRFLMLCAGRLVPAAAAGCCDDGGGGELIGGFFTVFLFQMLSFFLSGILLLCF